MTTTSSVEEHWLGASLPRGYKNVTDQVDVRGLDLLNADAMTGTARGLFDKNQPQTLGNADNGKGKEEESEDSTKDWVESDTDEQLMLFVPFQSTLKVHSLQVTSLPGDEDGAPMRPRTLRIYSNRTHCLDFAEAEGTSPTQEVVLEAGNWDDTTGTATAELRFVKFQNVSSLVVFIVDGDGDSEKVRLDRLRVVGEAGEKREMGKLEKVGEES